MQDIYFKIFLFNLKFSFHGKASIGFHHKIEKKMENTVDFQL